ncbi:MAG: LysR family transcriptional regulator [Pseudomonadales bacterium]
MDIELLRTFIAVADSGSFTRAAGQIYRSQSAISMQVKRLEEQLDRQLFIRGARSLKLSPDGRALVPYARKLIVLHDEAVDNLLERSRIKHLRIGCPDDYSHNLLPELILLLRQQIPRVQISLTSANSTLLRQHLDSGELDLTVLTRAPAGNEGSLILQEQGVWVCNNPALLQQRPLPLALFEPSCKFHSSVIDALEKRGIAYDILCEGSNSNLLLQLVKRECAISVMTASAVPAGYSTFQQSSELPALPVAEIVLCAKGANPLIEGIPLESIAEQLRCKLEHPSPVDGYTDALVTEKTSPVWQ